MKTFVSVIVPAYNVQLYIRECIESIIAQTYKNYEIIIVDDGSTDSTLEICNDLQSHNEKIKIVSKKNEGVSVARNVGISMAKGEWIAFVDADDTLSTDYLYHLVNAVDDNINVVGCGFYSSNNAEDKSKVVSYESKDWYVDDYLNLKCRNFAVWAHLFRRKIIVDYDISFDKDLSMSEDTLFYLQLLEVNTKIRTINKVLYWHRLNDISACGSEVSFNKLMSFALAEFKIITKVNGLDKKYIIAICDSLERMFVKQYSKYKTNSNEKEQLFNSLKAIQTERSSCGMKSNIIRLLLMRVPTSIILAINKMMFLIK